MLCYAQLSRAAPRKTHSPPTWIATQTALCSQPTERSFGTSDCADGARHSNGSDIDHAISAVRSTGNSSRVRHGELSPLELLEDLRGMIVADSASAGATALRLATLLSRPSKIDTAITRGGLAPWQQRKLDQYLKENLSRPLRLRLLAELVNLSVSHFNRSFKTSRGVAPHRYIVQLRLELAQSLMRRTNEPLCDIALACGLTDQAHLTKLFRRHVGQTPNAWRRKYFTEEGSAIATNCRIADQFVGNVHRGQSRSAQPVYHPGGCE
jgi:AraC family transcriptional regulator